MSMIDEAEAFVLAGGGATRMGTPKALLRVGGVEMLRRVANVLQEVFVRVSVVTDRRAEALRLGLRVISDRHKGCGPLGGLQAALAAADRPQIFVAPCDLPFLAPRLIIHLWERHAGRIVTIPSCRRRRHPLPGFYDTAVLPIVEGQLAMRCLAMHRLLRRTDVQTIPIGPSLPFYHPHLLLNVNTPQDLRLAERVERTRTAGRRSLPARE
jgi:molybdopterin-guanine dinucleotide biosynthesis protein A